MTGTEFANTYAKKGPTAWEAAAFELARQNQLTPRAWVPLQLQDTEGNTATLQVASDVLAVGPANDSLRPPLTPLVAQDIANLSGALLPTPWLVYQIWRQSPIKLTPTSIAAILRQSNQGPDMGQYVAHSQFLDRQIQGVLSSTDRRVTGPEMISGAKKDIVVSNIYQPKKVLIFGWYRPAPDVFDDRQPMESPTRQPVQPNSNLHAAGYVDYSHGIRLIHPMALVNGRPMATEDLYRHPTLSKLVSHEGAVKVTRYPSRVVVPGSSTPAADEGGGGAAPGAAATPTGVTVLPHMPSYADAALHRIRHETAAHPYDPPHPYTLVSGLPHFRIGGLR